MRRFAYPVTRELRASLKLHAIANKEAKVAPKPGRAALRSMANAVRRELKHDAMMNAGQRSRFERLRQARLTAQRAAIAAQKRVGDILTGLQDKERKTELGIILPSGRQIGELISRVRD